MMVRVPDIPTEGLGVTDAAALGTVYRDPSWHLEDVQLRIERDGLDVFVTGELRATVTQTCGRCLEPLAATAESSPSIRPLTAITPGATAGGARKRRQTANATRPTTTATATTTSGRRGPILCGDSRAGSETPARA